MAISRLGGSRRKIKGLLGDEIYQIVSDGERGFEQKVYSRPEDKALSLSPALARQRMCMAILYKHLPLLNDFIGSGFADTPQGALSFQELVRVNLKLLQDAFDNGSSYPNGVYWPAYGTEFALPCSLLLTDVGSPYKPFQWGANYGMGDYGRSMIYSGWIDPEETLEYYLSRYDWQQGDCFFMLQFFMGKEPWNPHYEYWRIRLRDGLDPAMLMQETYPNDVFIFDGSLGFDYSSSEDDGYGSVEWRIFSKPVLNLLEPNGVCYLWSGVRDGKWQYKSTRFVVHEPHWSDPFPHWTKEEAYKTWYTDRVDSE